MNRLQQEVKNYLNDLEQVGIKHSSLTCDDSGNPRFKLEIKEKIINSCQNFLVFNLLSFSDKYYENLCNEGFYWVVMGREIFLEVTDNRDFRGNLFVKFPSWVMPMKIYHGGLIFFLAPQRGDRDYFIVIDYEIVRTNFIIRNRVIDKDGSVANEGELVLVLDSGWKIMSCDELKLKLDQMKTSPQHDKINEIKFYRSNEDYYGFTNFFHASFHINEIPPNLGLSPHLTGPWKTSEHLFQASKFTDPVIIEKIRQVSRAREAFDLANSRSGIHRSEIRSDWNNDRIKLGVMEWIVEQKFTQNETLKNELLSTGDAKLIEASEGNDNFWGQDNSGNGTNHLGKILERVRRKLATTAPPSPPKPNPPSPPSPPQDPPQSRKENLKNLIKTSNDWEEWNNNYSKVSFFNFQEQQELCEELLNNLISIIDKCNNLTTLNNLKLNWINHQFYTQNSERSSKIDQFYHARRIELEKSNSSFPPSPNHFKVILISFLLVGTVIFLSRYLLKKRRTKKM